MNFKLQLNSPIINVWEIRKGKLIQVDLFSSQVSVGKPAVPPSIYIGMYHKQVCFLHLMFCTENKYFINQLNTIEFFVCYYSFTYRRVI